MKNIAYTKYATFQTWGWGSYKTVLIPKGSKCVLATNLPEGSGYWLRDLPPEMQLNDEFKSWFETYGFRIKPEEVA